jgi:hypothetical protein
MIISDLYEGMYVLLRIIVSEPNHRFLHMGINATGGIFAVVDAILPGNSIDPLGNLFLT